MSVHLQPTISLFGTSVRVAVKQARVNQLIKIPGIDGGFSIRQARGIRDLQLGAEKVARFIESKPADWLKIRLPHFIEVHGISTQCACWIIAKFKGGDAREILRQHPRSCCEMAREILRSAP